MSKDDAESHATDLRSELDRIDTFLDEIMNTNIGDMASALESAQRDMKDAYRALDRLDNAIEKIQEAEDEE